MKQFKDYHLDASILKALELLQYHTPTPIQRDVLENYDKQQALIIKADTGSGKTASYAIPICNIVDWHINKIQAIILVPTRELALQVQKEVALIGKFKRIRVEAIYGKADVDYQLKQLKQRVHILVATPGRLSDIIHQIDVSQVKHVVIDEADELMHLGFEEQMQTILDEIPENAQYTMVSATMDASLHTFDAYVKNPIFIENKEIDTQAKLTMYKIQSTNKLETLKDILYSENAKTCFIFCNMRESVEQVYTQLKGSIPNLYKLHGEMHQKERIATLKAVKRNTIAYVVSSDVAARGIDVEKVDLIIHYDAPTSNKQFIHRSGRSARKDETGKIIIMYEANQEAKIQQLEASLGVEIHDYQPVVDEQALQAFCEQMRDRTRKQDIAHAFLDEVTYLHIHVKRKSKIRNMNIVAAITSIDTVEAKDIGIIQSFEQYILVEILNQKGNLVYDALKTTTIKGKVRRVTIHKKDTYHL